MAPQSAASSEGDSPEPGHFKAPAALIVALFIVLRDLCPQWRHWPPVETLLKLTGAARSQAYEYAKVVGAALPGLLKPVGRPPQPAPPHDRRQAVQAAVQDYVRTHPGALCGNGARAVYSDRFRRFVVGLQSPGELAEEVSVADLAEITGVPIGTLKGWFTVPHAPSALEDEPRASVSDHGEDLSLASTLRDAHHRLIVKLWPAWEGSFQAFCAMLRVEHRLTYGDTYIGSLLQALGLRSRKRRIPVEAPWSPGTYQTFYPGAHWVGDGTTLAVKWGQVLFAFNVQVLQDVASNATVGYAVTDSESEEALRKAYQAALETTMGQPPVALTLDNKPCNHSPGALEAHPGTTLLHATPGRGQAKAPIEGAFGLFMQTMPPLEITATTLREQARQALELWLTAWYRGRNGKPRKRLKGKTPAEVYRTANPTPEEIELVKAWVREQQRRETAAHRTREARTDPIRLELLRQGLAELGIDDAGGRLAVALAYYSREAIVRGLATFRGKQELGKLPAGVEQDPGRYLGGIIRQLDSRLELESMAANLLQQRLRLRDLTLAPLINAADRISATVDAAKVPEAFVDRALDAKLQVDARFWMLRAAEALSTVPDGQRVLLYTALARRVAASFGTDRIRREDIIADLSAAVIALETDSKPSRVRPSNAGAALGPPSTVRPPWVGKTIASGQAAAAITPTIGLSRGP